MAENKFAKKKDPAAQQRGKQAYEKHLAKIKNQILDEINGTPNGTPTDTPNNTPTNTPATPNDTPTVIAAFALLAITVAGLYFWSKNKSAAPPKTKADDMFKMH